MVEFEMLVPGVAPDTLGLIPYFLDADNPQTASQQFEKNYKHGGGWWPMKGHKLDLITKQLKYPGDPPLRPLAQTWLRDEQILVYDYAFVVILQRDGTFEVARMD